jgi:hypothetical protein
VPIQAPRLGRPRNPTLPPTFLQVSTAVPIRRLVVFLIPTPALPIMAPLLTKLSSPGRSSPLCLWALGNHGRSSRCGIAPPWPLAPFSMRSTGTVANWGIEICCCRVEFEGSCYSRPQINCSDIDLRAPGIVALMYQLHTPAPSTSLHVIVFLICVSLLPPIPTHMGTIFLATLNLLGYI